MPGRILKISRGGGTPGGNNTELQYNNAGSFGGCAQLFWDSANNRLGLGDSTPAKQLSLTKCMELLDTTTSAIGVIYKGASRFLHNFHHPTGGGAIPDGKNLFLGKLAGNFTTGSTATSTWHSSKLIGIGNQALQANVKGFECVAVGNQALMSNLDGNRNMAVGTGASQYNTEGSSNMALGRYALLYNVAGSKNSIVGSNAAMGVSGTSIHNNTIVGYQAGLLLTNGGDRNILIGYQAGDNISSGEKNIIIGYDLNALVAASDYQLSIGGVIFGDLGATKRIGINTSTMNETLNVGGAIRLGTSALTNNGAIRWTGTDFEGYNAAWLKLDHKPGGNNTYVQFNDSGVFGGDSGLVYNKTKNMLSVGVPWGAVYPFDSYEGTVEAASEKGEWGVLGASRSSDSGVTGSMRCLGVYGFVKNDSNNSAYALYTEARKTVSTPNGSTSGAEIVILNRYNSQVDVTPSSNPAQATYGLALTSGVTYDAVQDYDASVGLYLDEVGAKFRRGIVISTSALRDHGGGKYIGIALPSSARIAWVNDNNCIMGNATEIDTLIGNNVISSVTSTKVTFNKEVVITEGIKIGDGGAAASAGMIRWSGTHFLGYNGSAWVQLDN